MAALRSRSQILKGFGVAVRLSSSGTVDDIQYPPIKPKYPPGRWSGFSPAEAWKWFEDLQAIDRLPTVQQRLQENIGFKNQLYYFDAVPFSTVPNMLDFYREVTKSELHPNLRAEFGKKLDEKTWKDIQADIERTIEEENYHLIRYEPKTLNAAQVDHRRSRLVLDAVLTRLIVLLSSVEPQLLDAELDREAHTQTYWIRGGENMPKDVFAQVLPSSGAVRFGYKNSVAFQLRSHLPLSASRFDTALQTSAKKDVQPGQFNPHRRGLIKKCYSLPHQPGFMYGAPSDFVNLSVLHPGTGLKFLKDAFKGNAYQEAVVTSGLLHSFATLNAVANYHGYDLHHDLTHPLLTQTLVTDGKEFTMLTYQMNTLSLLRGQADNELYNTYSVTAPQRLYENVNEEGKVVGYNPDSVRMIAECLLAKLDSSLRNNPYVATNDRTKATDDLLPYLPVYHQNADLPVLEEGSVPIPSFVRYNDGRAPKQDLDLPRHIRVKRRKEREQEAYITKGPLHDSYEPPARGKTVLDLHFEKVRKQERLQRIKHRDEVYKYLESVKQDKPSPNTE